jgi:murein DD-endopeptidase MepM/ murein hydrolase activator NlpD
VFRFGIDHGPGLRTRYGHLAAYRVSPGDVVGRGEVIGEVGSTGRSKRPHLHFEIWYRDIVRDPRKHLDAEPACLRR